jgi:hypothetical protein
MTESKKGVLSIVKIGENIVDNPQALESFLNDFINSKGINSWYTAGGDGIQDGKTTWDRDQNDTWPPQSPTKKR